MPPVLPAHCPGAAGQASRASGSVLGRRVFGAEDDGPQAVGFGQGEQAAQRPRHLAAPVVS